MTLPRADLLTAALFVGGLACLLVLACGCASVPNVRVVMGDAHCGALALSPTTVLTSAHCAAVRTITSDEADCDGQRVRVTGWSVHPGYTGEADHDLAVARLAAPLACYRQAHVEWAEVGDPIVFHGALGVVEEADGQSLVFDVDPQRVCLGDSGRPIFDGWGNAVGLVSRWWGGMRGCTYLARATALAANRGWIEEQLAPPRERPRGAR